VHKQWNPNQKIEKGNGAERERSAQRPRVAKVVQGYAESQDAPLEYFV